MKHVIALDMIKSKSSMVIYIAIANDLKVN